MKKLLIIFLLSASISNAQTFGTIRDNDHASPPQEFFMKKNPCGHGGQPPCTIPIDNEIWVLVVAGILTAIYRFKK